MPDDRWLEGKYIGQRYIYLNEETRQYQSSETKFDRVTIPQDTVFGIAASRARTYFLRGARGILRERDKNRCRACCLGVRIKCTRPSLGVPRRGEQRSLSRSYLYTLSWLALVILESSRRLIEALEDPAVSFCASPTRAAFDYIRAFMNMHDERWAPAKKFTGPTVWRFEDRGLCSRERARAERRSLTIAENNRNWHASRDPATLLEDQRSRGTLWYWSFLARCGKTRTRNNLGR